MKLRIGRVITVGALTLGLVAGGGTYLVTNIVDTVKESDKVIYKTEEVPKLSDVRDETTLLSARVLNKASYENEIHSNSLAGGGQEVHKLSKYRVTVEYGGASYTVPVSEEYYQRVKEGTQIIANYHAQSDYIYLEY